MTENHGMGAPPRDWVEYWDALDEGQLLFRPEADEYVRNLAAAVPLSPALRVLEFGCGYGFVAEGLAGLVGEVFLWDAAPGMLRHASARLAARGNVRALDLSDPAGDAYAPRFDLVLVNSVVQYLTPGEFAGWLRRWRGLLAPGGQVVVSDLSAPGASVWRDVLSLLSFSARRGYLRRAVGNVLAERGRYGRMAAARPLYRPGREEVARLADEAGLGARFLARNLTHFSARAAVVLTVDDSPAPSASEGRKIRIAHGG